MAKRVEHIVGLHNLFPVAIERIDGVDELYYDLSVSLDYNQSVTENTVLFVDADSEDVNKYIHINSTFKRIRPGDNYIITEGKVYSNNFSIEGQYIPSYVKGPKGEPGKDGAQGPVGPTGPQGPAGNYTAGTNIDITDNVISAKGYVFGGPSNSFAEGISTASGAGSHAESTSTASGTGSHSEGSSTAIGSYSHAEGEYTKTQGYGSHAEGYYSNAIGSHSHAEGGDTTASNTYAHAEGQSTKAQGQASHAEGRSTTASGGYSHAEGSNTTASGDYSHAEGSNTTALGGYSHAEGSNTTASNGSSHAEGYSTKASGGYSHAEGSNTTASGEASHAEGYSTKASGKYSHAEGQSTKAEGVLSHTEGYLSVTGGTATSNDLIGGTQYTFGSYAHAEGNATMAKGISSHSEGEKTFASGSCSHAEGCGSHAEGIYSHTEGYYTHAKGSGSHAEGWHTQTTNEVEHASGKFNVSNKESDTFGGNNTIFSIGIGESTLHRNALEVMQNGDTFIYGVGEYDGTNINTQNPKGERLPASIQEVLPKYNKEKRSVCFQYNEADNSLNEAQSDYSFVIGYNNKAIREETDDVGLTLQSANSFVGGMNNRAYHSNSIVFGEGLFTQFGNTFVLGKYNNTVPNHDGWGDTVLGVVGDGYKDAGGNVTGRNILLIQGGNDPALHCRGGFKNNASWINDFGEYFEWLDGNPDNEDRIGYMVQLNGDKIELATSLKKCIGVISGTTGFIGGVCAFEWHNKFLHDKWGREIIGEDGNPIINPDYNPELEYIPREQRKEWDVVGLVGQVITRQDGTLEVGGYAGCSNGIATNATRGFKVLKVIDNETALLLVK